MTILIFFVVNHFPREPLSRLQTLHAAGLVPRARIHCCPHGDQAQTEGGIFKPSVVAQLVSYQHAQDTLLSARFNFLYKFL